MRRSQSATEFLILFAIVGIVVVILVVLLTGVPGATDKQTQIQQSLLANQALGISNVVNSCIGVTFDIRNNEGYPIYVNYITMEGVQCTTENFTLAPTKTKSAVCYHVAECTQGNSFSYDYTINYQSLDTGVAKILNGSAVKVAGIATGSEYGLLSGSLLDQLEGYWDGSGNDTHIYDVYNNNYGTLFNVTRIDNQSNGPSLHWLRNGSDVQLDTTIRTHPNATSWAWWMRLNEVKYMTIFSRIRGAGNGQIEVGRTENQFRFESRTNNVHFFNPDAGINVSDGSWHHYVMQFDSSGSEMWVNGVLVETGSFNDDDNDFAVGYFGALQAQASFDYGLTLNGSLDEIMVWNRSLTPEEIHRIYARTSPYFN